MSDTYLNPVEKCCPCCGADPEEDRRKDERIDMLERGAIKQILDELRAIRELLTRMRPPTSESMLDPGPPLPAWNLNGQLERKSITDRELPDWCRYDQIPQPCDSTRPLTLNRLRKIRIE